MAKDFINPPELFPSLQYGFSQVVTSTRGKLAFLSGQVAWNEHQEIVGPGDLRSQTWQTFDNIRKAMQSAGGSLSDIVAMRIYIVEDHLDESRHITEALKAHFAEDKPPATTWIGVQALANSDFLIEIEATAVIE